MGDGTRIRKSWEHEKASLSLKYPTMHQSQLKQVAQEAMKKIADATSLYTAQITGIFKANRVASINDIVDRLHEQSKVNRSTF